MCTVEIEVLGFGAGVQMEYFMCILMLAWNWKCSSLPEDLRYSYLYDML